MPFYIISLKQSKNEIRSCKALEIQVKNKILVLNGEIMEIENLNQNTRLADLEEWKNGLFDLIYPVGTYYETSDIWFNPMTEWGGTWVMDTKGLVTVGAIEDGGDSPKYGTLKLSLGSTTGEAEHTLTINEMPSHSHGISTNNQQGNRDFGYDFTYDYKDQLNTGGITAVGGGQSHNNVQPSIGVYRWHRTA